MWSCEENDRLATWIYGVGIGPISTILDIRYSNVFGLIRGQLLVNEIWIVVGYLIIPGGSGVESS